VTKPPSHGISEPSVILAGQLTLKADQLSVRREHSEQRGHRRWGAGVQPKPLSASEGRGEPFDAGGPSRQRAAHGPAVETGGKAPRPDAAWLRSGTLFSASPKGDVARQSRSQVSTTVLR